MKLILPVMFLSLFLSCKQGKKDNPAPIISSDTAIKLPVADSTVAAGKIDIESFGPLKLGQSASDIIRLLGEPAKKEKPVEWGADGLMHEDWTWTAEALELNFSYEKGTAEGNRQLFSITASEPNTYKTKAGIGIGSSIADIRAAYPKDVNKEESSSDQVVVGSVYGGILFTLRNNKVIHVFVGAAAE